VNIYGDNNNIEHASEQNKQDCVNLYIALNSDPNVEYPHWLYDEEEEIDENQSDSGEELPQTVNKVNVDYKLLSINDTLNSLLNCSRKMKIIQSQSSHINSVEIENDERILLHVVGNLISNLYNFMKDGNMNQFIHLIRLRDLENNNSGIIWMINIWLHNWLNSDHRVDIVSRASKHEFVDDINYSADPNLIPLNITETMILTSACVSLMILYLNKIIEFGNSNNSNNYINPNNISINDPSDYNMELRDISSLSEDLLHTVIDYSKQCIDNFTSEYKLESSINPNNNALQSSINSTSNIELESILKLNLMNNNNIELFLCLVNSMGEMTLNVTSSMASYISSIIKASMLLINSSTSGMILSIYSSILSFIDTILSNQPEGLGHLYIKSPSLWSISNFGKYPVSF
jgi:hypothetical protein